MLGSLDSLMAQISTFLRTCLHMHLLYPAAHTRTDEACRNTSLQGHGGRGTQAELHMVIPISATEQKVSDILDKDAECGQTDLNVEMIARKVKRHLTEEAS